MKTPLKVKALKISQKLIGLKLPTNLHGHAGRALEQILEDNNIKINRGYGVDIEILGVEVKTRELGATSSQTIADMSLDDIINNDYHKSHVYEKCQRQFRVHTNNNVIVSAEIYDFSTKPIQTLLETAYNHARQQLIKNKGLTYTNYNGFYGYFEKCAGHTSYSFRLSNTDMKTIEKMAKCTYTTMFSEVA